MKTRYLNMDIVRYVLSIAVIIAHFNLMTGAHIMYPITSGTAVGVFFGLSGYLVYGSFEKYTDLRRYIQGRAKRILPPYLFIVLLCAFGLSIVSSLSFFNYFTRIEFWKYLVVNICFLNFLQPDLPGVFSHNTIDVVNGSLWTLKVEWALYLSIPLFFWGTRKYKWNIPLTIIVICLASFIYSYVMGRLSEEYNNPLYYKFSYQFVGQLAYFYTGVLVYHYKDKLAGCKWPWMLLLAICVYAIIEDNLFDVDFGLIGYLCPMILVFVTLLFSLSRNISPLTSKLGNVSYEMYLFHFPVIQLAVNYNINRYFSDYVCCLILLCIIILLSIAFQQTYKCIMKHRSR